MYCLVFATRILNGQNRLTTRLPITRSQLGDPRVKSRVSGYYRVYSSLQYMPLVKLTSARNNAAHGNLNVLEVT